MKFEDLKQEFLRSWASYNPTAAFSSGWREFAGQLPMPTKEQEDAYRLFLENMRQSLEEVDYEVLDETEKMDYLLLQNKIDADLFMIDDMESSSTNPINYVYVAFIFDYLLKDYAPLDQRARELSVYLNQFPYYYQLAISNLIPEKIAPENAEMAISMTRGMLHFLNNLVEEVRYFESDDSKLSEDTVKLLDKAKTVAYNALEEYLNYLEKNKENFRGSFRLGKERFEKMLKMVERVDIGVDRILEVGMRNLEHNYKELLEAARKIDPNRDPLDILDEIKLSHPTTETLVQDTQAMLDEIRTFLIETQFVSVPSEVMPTVIYTPKPFREWAFAAMDTPGALEKKATDSYYYITPPDENWTDKEKEEWLQTFNYKQLLDISVHEVFPGHYLHHLHNQRSSSLMAKLFGAYHFWEGYALYVEEAMYQHGFHAEDYEYRMMQLVETLIRNVRLVCAIKYHTTDEFTVEDGKKLFMEKGFLGEKPAESEAKRGTYDWGYLNYALGKLMIEKLREDYRLENGGTLNVEEFHNKLLSYGAPPIPLLRQFMLKNDDKVVI